MHSNPTLTEDKSGEGRLIAIEGWSGLPIGYSENIGRVIYWTPCCHAAASIDEHGTMYCKRCYHPVDSACGGWPFDRYCSGCLVALDKYGRTDQHGHADNCPVQ